MTSMDQAVERAKESASAIRRSALHPRREAKISATRGTAPRSFQRESQPRPERRSRKSSTLTAISLRMANSTSAASSEGAPGSPSASEASSRTGSRISRQRLP